MNDPTHFPLSETLKDIRLRAGLSAEAVAQKLEVPLDRIYAFERDALPDQALLDFYGLLARKRTYSAEKEQHDG